MSTSVVPVDNSPSISPLAVETDLLATLDDLTRQTRAANPSELQQLLKQHDYRSLAHEFAEKLRREARGHTH